MRIPLWILFVSLVQATPQAEKEPSYFALEDNDQIIVGEWGRNYKNVEPRSGSGDSEATTDGNTSGNGTSTAASTTTTTDGTSDDSDDSTEKSSSTQLGVHVILSVFLCINSM